jgi:hypothetical protein
MQKGEEDVGAEQTQEMETRNVDGLMVYVLSRKRKKWLCLPGVWELSMDVFANVYFPISIPPVAPRAFLISP